MKWLIGMAVMLAVFAVLYLTVQPWRLRQWIQSYQAHSNFQKAITDPAEKARLLAEQEAQIRARADARVTDALAMRETV